MSLNKKQGLPGTKSFLECRAFCTETREVLRNRGELVTLQRKEGQEEGRKEGGRKGRRDRGREQGKKPGLRQFIKLI